MRPVCTRNWKRNSIRKSIEEIEDRNEASKLWKGRIRREGQTNDLRVQDSMQKEETQLLQMAKKAKESVLLKKFQNGPDIIKAMEWLKNNHDQFAGHVYDPLI